jgi:hypothetical protein
MGAGERDENADDLKLSNSEEKLRVLEGSEVPFTLIGYSIFNAYVQCS